MIIWKMSLHENRMKRWKSLFLIVVIGSMELLISATFMENESLKAVGKHNLISNISYNPDDTIRYVASTGNDNSDCRNPLSPCRSIQYAVNQSDNGDTILVAEGTYTYNSFADICSFLRTRAVVCFVDKRLAIIGGYTANNWLHADPHRNLTIIDGENSYRGVAVIGCNTTNTHLQMVGFTIKNGLAQGPTYISPYDPSGVGGGMLVQHASVFLKDMIFYENMAIGANTNSGYGGQADGSAIRIEESPPGTTSYIQNVTFENNYSYGGVGPERGGIAFGALFIYKSNVTLEYSNFINNLARAGDTSGNGMIVAARADALGGGISIEQGEVIIRGVNVINNQVYGGNAKIYGGGAYGGGIFVEDFSENKTHITISNSYVKGNKAIGGDGEQGGNSAGGGITSANATINIEETRVMDNKSIGGDAEGGRGGTGAGGGLYIFNDRQEVSANFSLKNVIIAENVADQGNGNTSAGNGGGGGIVAHGVNGDIIHATIVGNILGMGMVLGQGLLVQPWPSPDDPQIPATVNLDYCLIADHIEGGDMAAALVVQVGSSINFNKGMFAGNERDTNSANIPVQVGTINGLDTMLHVHSAGFKFPGPPNYDYHIMDISPAIDQAIGSRIKIDVDSQPRPFGSFPDIGADEFYDLSYFDYIPLINR